MLRRARSRSVFAYAIVAFACSAQPPSVSLTPDGGVSDFGSLVACADPDSNFCLQDPEFSALSQRASDDVWLLENDFTDAVARHWDGRRWSAFVASKSALHGIWAGAGEAWAVGDGGSIAHYDGETFSALESGTDATLRAIWGSAPNDLWAVGALGDAPSAGVTLHFDGKRWDEVACCDDQSSLGIELLAVAGSAHDDVWAVGDRGGSGNAERAPYAIHWDGRRWSTLTTSDTGYAFTSVWSNGSDDVWFGAEHQILHYDGNAITAVQSGVFGNVSGLWGNSRGEVWGVAGRGGIYHWDGATFRTESSLTPNDLSAIAGSGSAPGFAIGGAGSVLRNDGGTWRVLSDGSSAPLAALWGSGASDVWASGPLHWDGVAWLHDASGSGIDARDFCGFAQNDVFAVGDALTSGGGSGFLAHYDGASWTVAGIEGVYSAFSAADTALGPSSLRALFCDRPDDVWAAGQIEAVTGPVFTTLAHFDGTLWSPVDTPSGVLLNGIWGSSGDDIWAAGGMGTLLHYDGRAWSLVSSGINQDLGAIWGSAADDVWIIVEGAPSLLHYDGQAWSVVASADPAARLFGIGGARRDDVWVVGGGSSSSLQHWDGANWSIAWTAPAGVGDLGSLFYDGTSLIVATSSGRIFTR